jgi:hypothetical protein
MTKDEALRLALEALEGADEIDCDMRDAITAIKAALEAKDEPVAWGVFEGNLHDMFFSQEEAQEMAELKGTHAEVRPLYTTPPQRTWVGLTKNEVETISYLAERNTWIAVELTEAKLKEKNHG